MTPRAPLAAALLALLAVTGCVRVVVHGDRDDATVQAAAAEADAAASGRETPLRVATYNTSLNDDADGGLVRRLVAGDPAARDIAAMLQRVHPDLVLLNES